VLALVGFALGACAAGAALPSAVKRSTCAGVFTSVAGVVAIGGLLLAGSPTELTTAVITGVLASGMGAQAVAARRVGVPDVSTVVVTSTLALLVSDRGTRAATARRAAAVAALVCGAVCGALLLRVVVWLPLVVAASCLVTVGVGLGRRNTRLTVS
jgi:uncharacterized membrane protein YoaK (UPF0700 family)